MVPVPALVVVALKVALCEAHGGLGNDDMLMVAGGLVVTVTDAVAVVIPSFTVTEYVPPAVTVLVAPVVLPLHE